MVFELLEGIHRGFDWLGSVAMDGDGASSVFILGGGGGGVRGVRSTRRL